MKNPLLLLTLLVAACVPLLALPALAGLITVAELSPLLGLSLLLGMGFALRDESAAVKKTTALPNGAATVASEGIDLGHGAKGDLLANCELRIEAPALAVGELANGETMIFDVYHDTASNFGTEALLLSRVIVQTGAGGAGAAAATAQVRLPVDVHRHVRVKATNSASGDASGKEFIARLVF